MDGKQLKNSILQCAIQGKLVPQNPKDEPAQKLLERIAASRNGDVSPWSEAIGSSKNSKKSLSTSLRGAKATKQAKNPPSRIYRESSVWYEQVGIATPKDISDEIPFEIPESWAWCRLSYLVSLLSDGIHGTPSYSDSGPYYFVNGNNLKDCRIIIKDSTKRVSAEEYEKYKKPLNENTILVSINGTIGNIGYYNNEPIILGKSACYFNLLLNDLKEYITACLKSPYFLLYALENATGTTIKNVSLKAMNDFIIPLPPLAEQKRIVAKLEQVLPLAEEYGAAQEQLDKLNKELPEALKKSILQEAIQGKLVPQNPKDEPASVLLEKIRKEKQELVEQGKLKKKDLVIDPITKEELSFALPEKWEICRLGDLCYLVDGEKTSLTEILLDAKYLRGKSSAEKIQGGRFVKKGDNIILVDGENSGEVFEVPIDGIMGSTFKQIIVNKTMYKPYVMIQILAYKDLLRNSKKGAAIPHLNKDIFRNLPIGIPPISEQKRIVAKLEQLFKAL